MSLAAPQKRLLRRLRFSNALSILVWAAFCALCLHLLGLFLGHPMTPWIGALCLIALVFALFRDFRLEHRLAYKLDRLAGLQLGYATADSLSLSPQDPGPIGRVLLAEQAEALRGLSFAKLVPLPNRKTWLGALLACGAAALSFNLQSVSTEQVLSSEAIESASQIDTQDTLEALVNRMSEEAEASDNSYLGAVARSLEEKIEELAAAPDDAALQAQIEELLEHARRAFGDSPPSWLGASGQSMQASLQDFVQALEEEAIAAARAAARADPDNPAFDMYARDPELDARYAGRDNTETINNQSMDGASGTPDEGPSEGPMASAGGSPRRMEDEKLQSAGGTPVGAALNSGKGESDMAGLGTQDLADDASYRDLITAAGDEMSLTAEQSAGGNRIRIELAPEANEETQAAGQAISRFTPQELERAAMGAERSDIPVAARAVVARYLDRRPAASTSAEDAQ